MTVVRTTWVPTAPDGTITCVLSAAHLGSPDPAFAWFPGQTASRASAIAYQRDKWGALDGETALLEISAIRAKNLGTHVDRDLYKEQRINILAERLTRYRPKFVLFYGKMYQKIYERIAGVSFDAHGFARQGDTLCVIVSHPTARGNPAGMRSGAWWFAKGREMQLIAAPAAQALVACMPCCASVKGRWRSCSRAYRRPVDVGPSTPDLHVGFINAPARRARPPPLRAQPLFDFRIRRTSGCCAARIILAPC